MNTDIAIAFVGLLVSVLGGIFIIAKRLGRMEMKIDLMWAAFLEARTVNWPGGKRWTDGPNGDND